MRDPANTDLTMPRSDFLHAKIAAVFPEWSSIRISRWLGINSRTLQRWISLGKGKVPDDEVPPTLASKIEQQAMRVQDINLAGQVAEFVRRQQENGIDDEVIAAWLADAYKQLIGREID